MIQENITQNTTDTQDYIAFLIRQAYPYHDEEGSHARIKEIFLMLIEKGRLTETRLILDLKHKATLNIVHQLKELQEADADNAKKTYQETFKRRYLDSFPEDNTYSDAEIILEAKYLNVA